MVEFHRNRATPDGLAAQCKPCGNAARADWRLRHPGRVNLPKDPVATHASYLRRTYGITLAEYDALADAQGNVCAICARAERGRPRGTASRPLVVDHDHSTGAVRGLLCSACNAAIGTLGDTAEGLRAALRYLER